MRGSRITAVAMAAAVTTAGWVTVAVAGGPAEPIVADVNGDGRPDRVVLDAVTGTTATTCRAVVSLGLAGGGLGPAQPYAFLTLPVDEPNCPDLGVGVNLDADPPAELAVAWFAGPPSTVASTLLALDNFRISRGFDTIVQPSFVGTADFDGDGRLDVYEWTDQGEGFASYLNPGTGTLVPGPVRHCSGPLTHRLADFDRDAAMDVVIAYVEGCGDYFSGVVVIRDDGTRVDLHADVEGLASWTVEIGDVNRDGLVDVTTYNQLTDAIATFIGLGNGNFVRAPVAIRDYPTVRGDRATGIRVLANDYASTRAKVTIWSAPRHGTVKVTTDGTIIYTPNEVHGPTDTFVYRLTEDGRTSNAAVSLRIVD
ncbi:FG-GAP-like repeat-containing protein [Micromonospora sp. WMMD1102]|uniref:FG-GAP-like repeat-containing protein n=1 Tax=Micromonospora sp. WMMD1102 TaxID=3016105 RepID=UPI00241510F3|nr:FG-GAP-like repeat-containing protein [Micromonospora sp. WMMD1102]MDG4789587.1 FG-GAP-like repeat-containing protein [Micromonospora sp. WMMD1102]